MFRPSPELQEKLRHLPDKPGCYLLRNRKGTIIYVGKAVSLRKRVQSYFRASTLRTAAPKLRSMIKSVTDLEVMIVRNEAEALLTESSLIKKYRPRFNILLRDDKRYLALRADPREPIPRLSTCRIVRHDDALYFGPFPSAGVVREVLDFTEKYYGLRKCTPIIPDAETYRHCLNDIIRFCSAPCVGRVTPEQYRARFDEACAFLRGERLQVIEEVKERMREAAKNLDYEKAAGLRDTWLALSEMVKQRAAVRSTPQLLAATTHAGLEQLQTVLQLPQLPQLIEAFDISNLFGTHTVASMVAAVAGIPDRRLFRRFRIRSVVGSDDPRSMAEVVRRRYTRCLQEGRPLPQLILIDGGITQLRAARATLAELELAHLPAIGLAEELEKIVCDDARGEILLPRDSAGLLILRRLRDEAHRFALDYHRSLRNRRIRESVLDDIPGIGPVRKKALLQHFGSVARIAQANEAALLEVAGIDEVMAAAIRRATSAFAPQRDNSADAR